MGYHHNVRTVRLDLGGRFDFFGDDTELSVVARPNLGNGGRVVHTGSRTTLVDGHPTRAEPTTSIDVPTPTGGGWVDQNGAPATSWSYSVTVSATAAGRGVVSWVGDVAVPAAARVVNLDPTKSGRITAPTVAEPGATIDPATGGTKARRSTPARPTSNRAVVLGNSISDQINARDNGWGWFPQLCVRSKQRIQFGGVYATGGFTIEQIRDVHLPQVLALTGWRKPGAAFLLLGTNNLQPAGSNTFNFAASKSAYLEVVDALIGAGITPIVCLDPPITGGYGNEHRWNRWLVLMCQERGLVPPVDFYSALVDRVTGGIKASWAQDTKHPNQAGYKRMATYALRQGVAELFPPSPPPTAVSPHDTTNKVTNPDRSHFLTENPGVPGLALGWIPSGGSRALSRTLPAEGESVSGYWQTMSRTFPVATAGTAVLRTQSIGDVYASAGDWIEFTGRIRATGLEATGSSVRIFANLGSGNESRGVFDWSSDVEDGVFYGVRQIAPGTTGSAFLNVWLTDPTAAGTASVSVAEMTLRNLTTGQLLSV